MSHANAALTPRVFAACPTRRRPRLDLRGGVEDVHGCPRTAKKWADRYRAEGVAGVPDRSSRPHWSPTKTSPDVVRQIVRLRWRHRLGPVQIAGRLGMQASTGQAVLVRCRINRLSHIDRVTGELLRRYEHPHPGSPLCSRRHRRHRPMVERSIAWLTRKCRRVPYRGVEKNNR